MRLILLQGARRILTIREEFKLLELEGAMGKPHESLEKQVEVASERNVFALAVTIGFLVFLVTGDLDGGLTALQGFFVGFFAVFSIYVVACLLESSSTRSFGESKISLSVPGNVSITQAESENGITIQIHVSNPPALNREAENG
jgi:hypothetical protein